MAFQGNYIWFVWFKTCKLIVNLVFTKLANMCLIQNALYKTYNV